MYEKYVTILPLVNMSSNGITLANYHFEFTVSECQRDLQIDEQNRLTSKQPNCYNDPITIKIFTEELSGDLHLSSCWVVIVG